MTCSVMTSQLEAYIHQVGLVLSAKGPAQTTVTRIEGLNRDLLQSGFRLPEALRRSSPGAPYTRNLVHQNPQLGFAIIAMVWGPFQETSIHDHLNWCVMSVLENRCLAIDYDRLDDGSQPDSAELRVRSGQVLVPGSVVGLSPPPNSNIHKISNAGRKAAVTLHTYGDPGTRARMFDPVSGKVEAHELEFHHVWNR